MKIELNEMEIKKAVIEYVTKATDQPFELDEVTLEGSYSGPMKAIMEKHCDEGKEGADGN